LIRFFGGKGGVGKTTLAAAFALGRARIGRRTLLVSTDPAHSLGDALGSELGEEPRAVAPLLWAAEISGEAQARRRIEEITVDAEQALPREILPAVRQHLARATESPGTVESALLDRLTELVEQVGVRWDDLVVDSAPTGHMLRLLSLPALLAPWIEGLARQRTKARDVDRMAAGMLGGAEEAPDPLLERLHARRARLEAMRSRLATEALVHLVLVPEHLPLRETLRAAETVTGTGLRLGQVIVNRVVPETESGVLARRRDQQDEVLAHLAARFGEPCLVRVPLLPDTLTGHGGLGDLAEVLREAGFDRS
jgi:arsenite/tail-anchored protein-transporting ATPase